MISVNFLKKTYLGKLLGRAADLLLNIKNVRGHLCINNFSKEPIIVDLGACEGGFSEEILKKHANSKILLVEANPFLSAKLTKTFAGRNNIKICNAAIGAKPAEGINFYLCEDLTESSVSKSLAESGGGLKKEGEKQISAKVITLDNIYSLYNLRKIDLLKVDIEGSEWDMFENFSKSDFEKIDQISVEFHDFKDHSLLGRTEKCVKRLRNLGYLCIHIGHTYIHGSPYFGCLFFKAKTLLGALFKKR